ncbi:hypothetical protein Bca4012_072231 [Brassica carinata]
MFRPKKKKELSLVEELKELELLEKSEMVDIPDLENDDLIEENSLSVIVRCLNPSVHKVGGLVKALPPIWGMEDRVHGRGVGADRPDFLRKIPFWIRIRGLPVHLLKKQAVESLVKPLGKVETVELHAKNSLSVEYVRALVWINSDEPLQFRRIARFKCPLQGQPQGQPLRRNIPAKTFAEEGSGSRKGTQKGTQPKEGIVPRPSQSRAVSMRRTSNTSGQRRKTDRKGKGIANDSIQVWKQKEVPETPKRTNSKSTGESSVPVNRRSSSSGKKNSYCTRSPSSGPPKEPISVFERLGNNEDRPPEVFGLNAQLEPRNSGSKDLSAQKDSHEGRSSKGSKSPPQFLSVLGPYPEAPRGRKGVVWKQQTPKDAV